MLCFIMCLLVCICNGDLKETCDRDCDFSIQAYREWVETGRGTGTGEKLRGWDKKLSPCSGLIQTDSNLLSFSVTHVTYREVMTESSINSLVETSSSERLAAAECDVTP